MGFINLIRRKRKEPEEERALPFTEADLYGGMLLLNEFASRDTAGVKVTPETALTASAVLACVGRIARDISTLPVKLVDRDSGKRVKEHPVDRLLRRPNEYMTGVSFRQSYTMNLLLWGNGFAATEWSQGSPTAMLPLASKHTYPRRVDGRLLYVTSPYGTSTGIGAERCLHVPYLPLDGIVGRSPIQLAASTVGVSVALSDFVARFFSQGSHLNGNAFELPPMAPEALRETRRLLEEQYTGPEAQHRRLAMPGLKVHRLHDSMKESQAVESRQFQLREVARIYHVPVGVIEPEASTYGNLEAQLRSYAEATLRPLVVAIEAEWTSKLLTEAEQDRYEIAFNLDAVVRASLADRYAAHSTATGGGQAWKTINEVRELEGLPPVEGGDRLMSPLNMGDAAQRSADASDVSNLDTPEVETVSTPSVPDVSTVDTLTVETNAASERRQLLDSIANSIATKEANAVRKAIPREEDLEVWAESYFGDAHAKHIRERVPFVTEEQANELAMSARSLAKHCECNDTPLSQWHLTRIADFTRVCK